MIIISIITAANTNKAYKIFENKYTNTKYVSIGKYICKYISIYIYM